MVTILLVLLNLLVYMTELAAPSVCQTHGLVPAHPTINSVLSSMFMHDPTSMVHLGGNMICLAIFGTLVEREIGALRFAVLYFAAGVGGALLHILVNPAATAPMIGASGAICGVLAVAAVLRPRWLVLVIGFGVLNVWYAVAGTGGDISFGCHLGGLAVGAMFAMGAKMSGRLEA